MARHADGGDLEATVARGPRVLPFGDSGVLVLIDGEPGLATSQRVHATAARIRAALMGMAGWGGPIPGAASILVPVDPIEPGVDAAAGHLRALLRTAVSTPPADVLPVETAPVLEIPVRYGGIDGPDLEVVASMTGLAVGEVIEAHSAPTYSALFLGFAPGFAYLGPLDPVLVLPRRDEPRQRVPAGSVAIAGPQTAVYSVELPGGWWILGRTAVRVWDPLRVPAARIAAGARVRFVPERA